VLYSHPAPRHRQTRSGPGRHDERGRELGPWDPWSAPMRAYAYEARFVRKRDYRLHQRAAPLLARFVVLPTSPTPPEPLEAAVGSQEVAALAYPHHRS
jgi:hypothetical protein